MNKKKKNKFFLDSYIHQILLQQIKQSIQIPEIVTTNHTNQQEKVEHQDQVDQQEPVPRQILNKDKEQCAIQQSQCKPTAAIKPNSPILEETNLLELEFTKKLIDFSQNNDFFIN